jgi:hypothetical protein
MASSTAGTPVAGARGAKALAGGAAGKDVAMVGINLVSLVAATLLQAASIVAIHSTKP